MQTKIFQETSPHELESKINTWMNTLTPDVQILHVTHTTISGGTHTITYVTDVDIAKRSVPVPQLIQQYVDKGKPGK